MEQHGALLEIRIEPSAVPKPDGGWPLECQVQVTDGTGQPLKTYAVTIPQLLDEHGESELSWYLESYAQGDIFAKSRSSAVEASIKNYAQRLSTILTASEEGNDWVAGATLNVNVCAPISASSLIHALHWEVIESTTYWNETSRPSAVAVVRQLGHDDTLELEANDKQGRPTNILLVSARPQLEQDVPHRLASGVLVSVIESLPAERKAKVEAQFVRPGTFDSFTALLSKYGAGYFDTIHLDVHGIETGTGVALAFLKQTADGVAPDFVDGATLARVLIQYEVRAVIMNACRSAVSRQTTESLVAELIRGGVDIVIGMSFNAIASSVERFLAALYDAHLCRGLSLPAASHAARLKLVQYQGKMTKYGNEVDVLDALVPICYVRGSVSMSQPQTLKSEKLSATSVYSPSTNTKAPQKIHGRENDILLLETHFLGVSNIAILQGPAGIGKTALLNLTCDWWVKTKAIERAIYIELAEIHHENSTWSGLQKTVRKALRISDKPSWSAVLEHIKARRYCLCIDSLEAMAHLGAEARSSLRKDIKSLVKDLAGSMTCILITSRRDELWVSSKAYVHVVEGLSLAATMQYIRDVANDIGLNIPYNNQEQLLYLEKIIGLADYNPLVLYALLKELRRETTSMSKFYYDLVFGKRWLQDLGWARLKPGARSITELTHLLNVLSELPALDTMIDLTEARGATSHELVSSRARILKPLLKYSLTEESTCPIHFGFFWNRIAYGGLMEYIMFCSMGFGATGHGRGEHVANILAFSPEHELARLPKHIHQMSLKAAARELTPMKKLGYVSYRPESLSQDRVDLYYEVHPLLTLLSRGTHIFQLHFSIFAKAFVKYQAYRLRSWPWRCDYTNPVWVPDTRQASIEFTSKLCATLHAIPAGYRSLATHTSFKQLLWSIQKSLIHSVENQFIVTATWEEVYKELEKFPLERFYSEDYDYQAQELLVHTGKESVSEVESAEFEDVVLSVLHTLFYERVYFLGTIGVILRGWEGNDRTDRDFKRWVDYKPVLERIIALSPTGRIKDPSLADPITKLRERNKALMAPFEIFELAVPENKVDERDLLENLRRIRDRTVKVEEAVHGESMFDPSWQGLLAKDTVGGNSRRLAVDPRSASSASERLYRDTKDTVVSLWDIGEHDKAGTVIRDALYQAANVRGDYTITKIRLTHLLAKNFEKEGLWDDAYESWAEAERLENDLPSKTVSMDRLKRVIWLFKTAARKEKLVDSQKHKKRVLELANRAAVENEPDIEEYAMFTLAELEPTEGLESHISAIFLLIRGAKAQHRKNGIDIQYRGWLEGLVHKALDIQNLWEKGPPEDKPQSVLVYNASRLFGEYVLSLRLPGCPTFLELLLSWWHRRCVMEREKRLFSDLEERLFAGPGVEPRCRLLPASLRLPEHNALFEFMYVQGRVHLLRTSANNRRRVSRHYPEAPFAATGTDGGTQPPDYRFSTELMLKLAGYIIDW